MTWHALPENDDWVMQPVLAGLCRFESIKDCTLDLADIALMNDALACKADNEHVARKLAEKPIV